MNLAIIVGRLAHTPELKALPSGLKIAEFSVATNYSVQNKETQQWEDRTDWHNVKVFGKRAETVAQYLKGGDQVVVRGSMKTDSYEDKNGGPKRYRSYILMDDFEFGAKNMKRDDRQGQDGHDQSGPTDADAPDTIEYPEDDINPEDIPF